MADGTPVTVRAVTPEDAGALIDGFAQLSRESRTFRFLHAAHRLSPEEVAGFTSPDHSLHIALGAVLHEADGDRPAGIAHLFRALGSMQRAELAVTILDADQRRGLGALLLGRLLAEARRLGIETLDAVVHPGNHGMAHLLRDLGAAARHDGETLHFTLPVVGDPRAYGSTGSAAHIARAMRLPSGGA